VDEAALRSETRVDLPYDRRWRRRSPG